jgi:hypothetical protein
VPACLGWLRRLSCDEFGLDHERVVRGLVAEELDRARDGARRFRIRPPPGATAPGREATGVWLRGHLLAPEAALPFPVVRAADDEHGLEAMRRLVHGQALELASPGLRAPPGAADSTTEHVAVHGPCGALVVARLDQAGAGARWLRPERTVVHPRRRA